MPTFPNFVASILDEGASQHRFMELRDCARGDFVYVPTEDAADLFLVVQSGAQADTNALVGFGPNGPSYFAPYTDTRVIKINQKVVFALDQSSRCVSSAKPRSGSIQATSNGTYILVPIGQPDKFAAFRLDTFNHAEVRKGIEFTKWKIEVSDDDGRRATLFEYSVAD